MVFHSISPLSQEVVPDLAPPLSQNYLEHSRLSLTLVNPWHPVSKILKPCYHGNILGSPKDVLELQWYNLIGLVSEYVLLSIDFWWHSRELRLQVSQRLRSNDKAHVFYGQ